MAFIGAKMVYREKNPINEISENGKKRDKKLLEICDAVVAPWSATIAIFIYIFFPATHALICYFVVT